MYPSRRNFIKILGGGMIVAAAGIGTFAATRTPHKALAPWDAAGNYADPRKHALSYALLAPNPHNRQPWQVDLSQDNTAIIYRDKTRNLPHTDPFDRQLTIGMGCFLELMKIAASQTDHVVNFELFPDGEDGPVAVAKFTRGAVPDPLFRHVMNRRSCKELFEERAVPESSTSILADFADIITEPDQVTQIKKLTWDAWLLEASTPRTWKESVDLMRMGKTEINANPDGISLGGTFLETLMLAGILTQEVQLDAKSAGFKQGVKIYREMLLATPAYAVITSPANKRVDQIEAGRKWLRLNLATTSLGLSLHPVSQALQEYPEMKAHYTQAHKVFAKSGESVQMLGRLGFGPMPSRSPRWLLEAKIING